MFAVGAASADRWEETMTDTTRRSMLTGTAAVLGSMASTSTEAAAPASGKQAPDVYRYKVGTYPFPGLARIEKAEAGYRVVPAAWSPTL
jgi:hypothetical protein